MFPIVPICNTIPNKNEGWPLAESVNKLTKTQIFPDSPAGIMCQLLCKALILIHRQTQDLASTNSTGGVGYGWMVGTAIEGILGW